MTPIFIFAIHEGDDLYVSSCAYPSLETAQRACVATMFQGCDVLPTTLSRDDDNEWVIEVDDLECPHLHARIRGYNTVNAR